MTEPLLSSTDFGRFKNRDESWFLEAVGDYFRDECGWHIYPVLSVTDVQAIVGNDGIIMLPTLRLLSVEQIRCGSYTLDPGMYEVHESGYVQYTVPMGRRARGKAVRVDFTHGYEECPKPLAEVGFEVVADLLEKPNGVVTDMTRGPTRLKFKELGANLSDSQRERIGAYKIRGPA